MRFYPCPQLWSAWRAWSQLDIGRTQCPMWSRLDDVGRAVPVIPAKQVAVKDVRLQEATVARWITNLRTVVIDPVVQRKMVDEVYALASASSAASQTLTDWYQQNSPFSRLQKETVDVSIESIVQQSSKSYEVVWSESIHDLFGQLQGTHRYRAIVTVNTQEVTDPKQALINPLGLYVTNFSWGEVVSPGHRMGPGSHQMEVKADEVANRSFSRHRLLLAGTDEGALVPIRSLRPFRRVVRRKTRISRSTTSTGHSRSSTDSRRIQKSDSPPLRSRPYRPALVPQQPTRAASKPAGAPPDWRAPHADLNATAASAAAVADAWESGFNLPTPGADGRVLYTFGDGMPVSGLRAASGLRFGTRARRAYPKSATDRRRPALGSDASVVRLRPDSNRLTHHQAD